MLCVVMAKACQFCWRHARKCLLILIIVSIISIVHFNYVFNMSEHFLTPAFLPSIFHRNSSIYRPGSPGAQSNRFKHTLVDLPKITLNPNSSVHNGTSGTLKHSILWYNKPSWIDMWYGNSRLASDCAYRNCKMTTDKGDIQSHSAIVFCFTETFELYPPVVQAERSPNQAWIFFGIESPVNLKKIYHRHASWKNTMNWSMTYRRDSDIFHPYGSLELRKSVPVRNYSQIYLRKTKFAAWFVSNCGVVSGRDEYVAEMRKHGIPVDIFGNCANKYQDRHYLHQLVDEHYKFYLSFENSLCKDYVTEKFFRNYNLNVVLIVRGGSNYSNILPPDVYIDTASFPSVKELATFLLRVNSSESEYTSYLQRKDRYQAREMFSMSHSYCSICEKLNNLDDNRKMYGDMVAYLHGNDGACVEPTDVIVYHYWRWLICACIIVLLMLLVLYSRVGCKCCVCQCCCCSCCNRARQQTRK